MPWIPTILLPILLTERWDTEKLMHLVPASTPMLMLSGLRDELVPPSHMVYLRDMRRSQAAKAEDTLGEKDRDEKGKSTAKLRWAEFPLGSHNDTCLIPDYWKEIKEWLVDEFGLDL